MRPPQMKPSAPTPDRPTPNEPTPTAVSVSLALLLDPGTAARHDGPLLDPRRWTTRHRWFVAAGLLIATVAALIVSVREGPQTGGAEAIRVFLAVAAGIGMIGLALSLRGLTLPGFLAGGLFVTAGMLSWAYTDTRGVVWTVLGVEAVLFAVWTFPWLRDLARLPRLGAAWLGLAYWLLGVIGALLVLRPTVAYQRLAYLGVFTLGALAVLVATRKSRRDLTIGMVAAFLVALAALFLVGAGNALSNVHVVPDNAWGAHMQYRFWGGPGLLYHPNSIALVAVIAAIRIAGDRAFERWQRYASLAMVTLVLLLVNSRTGLLYLGAATVVWAVLVWRSRRTGRSVAGVDVFASRRAALAGALLPIVLAGVIGVGSGGAGFLTAQRYGDSGGVTSGRSATWAQVWREFKADNVAQQVFGDAKFARGYVVRTDTGADAQSRPKLTTDNAAVGALRRGGVLGLLAFLFGLVLLLWHAIRGVRVPGAGRRPAPAWFAMAAIGSVFTIATSDWLLGNTGGTLWIFLVAAEAAILVGTRAGSASALSEPAKSEPAKSEPAKSEPAKSEPARSELPS